MNSAKFIALCFGMMTLITMIISPLLAVASAIMCAGVGSRCACKGINNVQYAVSALALIGMSVYTLFIMQQA